MPLAQAPHLDLLYPARKLWRKRLVSCRLCSLEAGVLGVTHDGDVPGWLIPDLYFDYVRYGVAEPLRPVFLHNALDVLSLVTLAARANTLLGEPGCPETEHAADLYSLGLIYESCGQQDAAQHALQGAIDKRLPPVLEEEALRRLSALYKRTGQVEQAARVWQTLREHGRPEAFLELSRYHERHLRDYPTAVTLVSQALALENLPARGECSAEALKRRLARLKRKLGTELVL